ncbi:MAG: biotin/lipoyl-binding protein [Opitutales bacterium]|nr:biotin/lipoyl-binding protein [Opitutales bacterium]
MNSVRLLFPFPWRFLPAMLGMAFLSACGNESPEENTEQAAESVGLPVAAVEVVPRDLSRTLSTSASVESRQTTRLAARLAGTVDEVFVTEGDLVEKGAVLIRLDTREIETELQAAEARKNRASQEYERAEELLASNLVSEAEYALRRTDLQIAEAEVAI